MNTGNTSGRNTDIEKQFVHLARLSVEGKLGDVHALLRKTLKKVLETRPDLAMPVREVLEIVGASNVTREFVSQPLPTDIDSRIELLRREDFIDLDVEPIWVGQILNELGAVLEERRKVDLLIAEGILPTKSLLFVGPPGVGKTMAAKYLGMELALPVLTLDLAGVMSSYLGKTGNNIKTVLDYARRSPCILLLDEFDAIAKRRDDREEIGELKRLVTVLLQAVDDWPSEGILIAATNHPDLLDPAVWRRFDRRVVFSLPEKDDIRVFIDKNFRFGMSEDDLSFLSEIMSGNSFSEIARIIRNARKQHVLNGSDIFENIISDLSMIKSMDRKERIKIARIMLGMKYTQRKISLCTGISRDLLRKMNASSVEE